MVGDDVVDLADAEVRPDGQHPRFDARVFASSERAALARSADADRMRWFFWAAKEAAYKLARKLDPRVVFSPRRFVVSLEADLRGRVAWPGGEATLRVRCDGDAVHATACDAPEAHARLLCGLARLHPADDPSREARALAVRGVAVRLGLPAAELRVERRGRIPRLRQRGAAALDLSLSHHGRFATFACDPGARP